MTVYEMVLDYADIKNKKQTLTEEAVNFLIENSSSKLYNENGELGYIFIDPAKSDEMIKESKNEFGDNLEIFNEIKEFINKFLKGKKEDVLFSVI
ncbi:MAG: hypothetical protein ACP5T6_03530, partial [Candidatus Micrarchaeia archaeon]